MEYMAFYSRRDTPWMYDLQGNPCLIMDGLGIYASSFDEAARLGEEIYLLVPFLSGNEQSRVILGDLGWRSSAATVVAGPWRNDDESGMAEAARMIVEAHNKGYRQVPGILLWAVPVVCEVQPKNLKITVEWGINHKNSMVRYLATRAAGCIGTSALPILLRAIGDEAEDVQMAAIEVAETMGAASLPVIEIAMKKRNPSIRRRAVAATRRMGDLALPILQSAMMDSDVDVRIMAVFVARLIGPSAFQILVSAASDNDPRVRTEAMIDADHFGHAALSVLAEGLKDRDRHVREAAKEALKRMGGAGRL